MLAVRVLGEISVWDGSDPVDLGGRLPARLLAALVQRAPEPVSVHRLLSEVWGDDTADGGDRRLRTLVNRLRRTLPGGPDVIETVRDGYRWAAPEVVDLHRYQELSDLGTRAALEQALTLWHGRPFTPLSDEPWIETTVEALCQRHAHDEETWAQLSLDEGRSTTLLPRLRRAVADEPLREIRWAQLVTALDRAGRPAEALAAYADASALLADQLGSRPGPHLQAAYEAAISQAPAGRSPGSRAGALTAVIGRDRELATVEELLGRCRLVTITGLGGIGKSRLAEEIVRRWRQRGRIVADAVVHPTSGPDELAASLAEQVGHGAAPEGDADAVLASGLLGVDLLVVDAAEHDPAAAEVIARLQTRRPHLAVLTTTRVPLGIADETVVALDGLPLPDPDGPWEGTAAELLLRVRGTTVAAAEGMAPGERDEIVAACRRTGGIPLALELVGRSGGRGPAHATGTLPAAGDDRVTSSIVDVLATIEPAATDTARALSVLPDGLGTTFLAATCDADEVAVSRHLIQLNRIGLTTSTAAPVGLRVRLADPVADVLLGGITSDGRAAVLSRFEQAIIDACERREHIAVASELVGIEAALAASPDPTRLARAVAPVWGLTGAVTTGLRWLRADEADPLERARTTVARARVIRFGSALGPEIPALDAAIEVLEAAGSEDAWVAAASSAIAWTFRGGHDEASARLVRAHALVDPADDWAMGHLCVAGAMIGANRGELDEATTLVERGEALLTPIDPAAAAQAGYLLGIGLLIFSMVDESRTALARARGHAEAARDIPLVALIGMAEASAANEADDPDTAAMFRRAAVDLERVGLRDRAAVARRQAGIAFLDDGLLDEAELELRRAAATLIEVRNDTARMAIAALADAIEGADPAEAAWMRTLARQIPLDPPHPLGAAERRRGDELLAPLGDITPVEMDAAQVAAIVERLAHRSQG